MYRKCVGVVVYREGKVLLCERRDQPGAWQFPQGGIEQGEDFVTAAHRELREETSVRSVELAGTIEEPLRYDFPPAVRKGNKWRYDGQEMQWVLFRFVGDEHEIDLRTKEPEFSRYDWRDIDCAVREIVDFKKNVYMEVVEKFKPIVED